MRSTLDEFLGIMRELRMFVDSIEPSYLSLSRHDTAVVRNCLSIRRRLDYAAFIVSLYAAFEKLVEDLAWSHTELEVERNRYSELVEKLREAHLKQSAELLTRRLGGGRYARIEPVDVIGNLHACLSDNDAYKLNREAIVHHDMNLRGSVVQNLFAILGIENINTRARQAEPMLNWFSKTEGREIASGNMIPERVIDHKMEDLVSRRNQVAHSGGDPGESFSPAEMLTRLEFIEAYSKALFNVLAGAYLDKYYVKTGKAEALGDPVSGPFQKGSVVVVRKPACRICVGQAIFGKRGDLVDRWGEVTELQVDGVPVNSIEVDSTVVEVGLRATFKLTKNTRLFVLENRDEAVWG